jgi:hypothetical protein
MSISISPLSSTGTIASAFHNADIQKIHQDSIMPPASKGIESRRGRRNEVASLAMAFSYDVAQMTSLFQKH